MTKKINNLVCQIPKFKTQCGETISGQFSYYNNIMKIELSCQGSQLLFYIANQIVRIIHNRDYKYFTYIEKIFWRINRLPMQGNRKEMAIEIVNYIKFFLQNRLPQA